MGITITPSGTVTRVGIASQTSVSAAINTTETIVLQATIPANTLVTGSVLRVKAYGTCTSTVSNLTTIRMRMGTAGTTSDAVMSSWAQASQTSGTNNPFVIELMITIRNGTSGTANGVTGNSFVVNQGVIGIAKTTNDLGGNTTATTPNPAVDNVLSFTVVSAAVTTTTTIQQTIFELVK